MIADGAPAKTKREYLHRMIDAAMDARLDGDIPAVAAAWANIQCVMHVEAGCDRFATTASLEAHEISYAPVGGESGQS